MSNGFIHSAKVPRLYKVTAATVQKVEEEGASIKQLIFQKKHPNVAGIYSLALATLQRASQLNELLQKTQILVKEQRLDPWLARVLITELLWGKKVIKSEAKPIQTINSYEKVLRKHLNTLGKTTDVTPIIKQEKKPRYVRVNTLVTSVQAIVRSFTDDGWILLPKNSNYSSYLRTLKSKLNESSFVQDFHIPELLVFPPGTQFHHHPAYKSGAILLQDKSSCFPAFLLKAALGSTVLDMCAAPGMKTTHLAALMGNQGKIFAIEMNKRRYEVLCKIVTDSRADCVTIFNADAMTVTAKRCPNVEYILVDPSCSGSGILDRPILDSTSSKCLPERLKSLQSFQVLLLRHALLSFPTVKRVVYSTCSLHPEENEMVIDEILENIGESYNLMPIKELLNGNWKNFSSSDYACKNNCLYSRPEIDYSNGFFVAVFERNFDVPLPEYTRQKVLPKLEHSEKTRSAKPEEAEEHFGKNRRKENKSNKTLNDTSADEERRKKKGKLTVSVETDQFIKTECPANEDKSLIEKKKKKKKKQFEFEESEVQETTENCENLTNDEEQVNKKRKRADGGVSMEVVDNQTVEKKKKKKQVDKDVSVELLEDQTAEKKKKKKKRTLSIRAVSDEMIIPLINL